MYVVVCGNDKISLYGTWDECFKKVNGVSGNKGYKKVRNEEELINFVNSKTGFSGEDISELYLNGEMETNGVTLNFSVMPAAQKQNTSKRPIAAEVESQVFPENVPYFYIDGSYNKETGIYGYGLVVVKDGVNVKELFESGDDEEFAKQMNVAGEIMGAFEAIICAHMDHCKEIVVCYDYKGIELWAIDQNYSAIRSYSSEKPWKAENMYTKEYKECMLEEQKKIKIHFKKIKAHSGNVFNDRADVLAKKAVGL